MKVPIDKALEAARNAGLADARSEFQAEIKAMRESMAKEVGSLVSAEMDKNQKTYAQANENHVTRRFSPDLVKSGVESYRQGTQKWGSEEMRGVALARFAKLVLLARGSGERPADLAERMYPNDFGLKRALGMASPSAGGFTVPVEFIDEIIPLLRDIAVVRAAGCRILPLNTGTLEIPSQTGGATAAYGAENTDTNATEQTFGNLVFHQRKLVTIVPVSNDLLRNSAISADQFIRDDMLTVMALKEDSTFLRGTGTANAPTGIRNITSVQINSLGTNGATPDMNTLPRVIRLAREKHSRFVRPAWIFSARTWETLYNLKTSTNEPIYRTEMDQGKLHGWPFFMTEQIPDNLVSGSSGAACSEIYFGDFNEAIIAEATEIDVTASVEASYKDNTGTLVSSFSLDQMVLKAIARHDFNLRQPTVFVVTTGVLAS